MKRLFAIIASLACLAVWLKAAPVVLHDPATGVVTGYLRRANTPDYERLPGALIIRDPAKELPAFFALNPGAYKVVGTNLMERTEQELEIEAAARAAADAAAREAAVRAMLESDEPLARAMRAREKALIEEINKLTAALNEVKTNLAGFAAKPVIEPIKAEDVSAGATNKIAPEIRGEGEIKLEGGGK